jgi:hypothetical protein
MKDFSQGRDFLADARQVFRQFYLTASPRDGALLDGLVMAHAALSTGMNLSRVGLRESDHRDLERACVQAEQKFSELREMVRTCPTFARIDDVEQARIERKLFEVRSPLGQ